MKALSIISALVILAAATLNAMPEYRLLNSNSGSTPSVDITLDSNSSTGGGGFGGAVPPFNAPQIGTPPILASGLSSSGNGGFGGAAQPVVIAQPNGPVPVPEPSSSWLLLALAIIPILKLRGNRKTRAS